MINHKKNEPTKPDPVSKHGGRIKASEFSKGLPAMKKLIAGGAAGTWDYVTNSVFDADNPEHRRKFYDTHGIDGKPVGIIGRTNHAGPFDESSEEAFKKIVDEGYTPSIGTWTDMDKNKVDNDVGMVVSADVKKLLTFKRKYNQKEILVVYSNGEPEFI